MFGLIGSGAAAAHTGIMAACNQVAFRPYYLRLITLFIANRQMEDNVMLVTAAEKTDQRKSEEAFLKAARDGNHEAVTTMVLSTVHLCQLVVTVYFDLFTFSFPIFSFGM